MRSLSRPSPAIVIAFIALFVAASGGAWAAGGVPGTGEGQAAQKGKAKKKKKAAKPKRGPRGKTGPKGSTGPAGAPGAQGPQGPQGPSAGFALRQPDQITTAITNQAEATVVTANLSLPSGNYIVNASLEVGGNSSTVTRTRCELRQGNTIVAEGAGRTDAAAYEDTIALTGSSTGGALRIACNPTGGGAFVRNRAITAVAVGSLTTAP
jgi:hypothetical protein